MLKKYILLTLSFMVATVVHSQNNIGIGMKAGYNSSRIIGEWEEFYSSDLTISPMIFQGANFGAYFEIPVARRFYLQPEILITMKGTKLLDSIAGSIFINTQNINYSGSVEMITQLYYLQIPLIFKYNLTADFGIVTGMYYAELLDVRLKEGVVYNLSSPVINSSGFPVYKLSRAGEQTHTRGYNAHEIGLIAGIELNFRKAGIFARYERGITSIFDKEFIKEDLINSTFKLGINFRLKRTV